MDLKSQKWKPAEWIPDSAWLNVCELGNTFKIFSDLPDTVGHNADKWKAGLKHNIYFNEHSSSFAIFEYARDKFASATQTITFAAGYTQRILDNQAMLWNADIGPGVVRTTMDTGEATRKIVHEN